MSLIQSLIDIYTSNFTKQTFYGTIGECYVRCNIFKEVEGFSYEPAVRLIGKIEKFENPITLEMSHFLEFFENRDRGVV